MSFGYSYLSSCIGYKWALMPWLINAAQADKFRKSQKSLIIMDASLHMPAEGRDAKQEFLDKHIPGAQFFDIDAFNGDVGGRRDRRWIQVTSDTILTTDI